MSRSQESTVALKAIWMEGYNRGRRDERLSKAPVVEISRADIEATYEPGFCQHPGDCPCSALGAGPAKPAPQPEEIERAEAALVDRNAVVAHVKSQREASEAREKVLREALEKIAKGAWNVGRAPKDTISVRDFAREALAREARTGGGE